MFISEQNLEKMINEIVDIKLQKKTLEFNQLLHQACMQLDKVSDLVSHCQCSDYNKNTRPCSECRYYTNIDIRLPNDTMLGPACLIDLFDYIVMKIGSTGIKLVTAFDVENLLKDDDIRVVRIAPNAIFATMDDGNSFAHHKWESLESQRLISGRSIFSILKEISSVSSLNSIKRCVVINDNFSVDNDDNNCQWWNPILTPDGYLIKG